MLVYKSKLNGGDFLFFLVPAGVWNASRSVGVAVWAGVCLVWLFVCVCCARIILIWWPPVVGSWFGVWLLSGLGAGGGVGQSGFLVFGSVRFFFWVVVVWGLVARKSRK